MVVGTMVGAGIFVLPGQFAPYGWTGAAAWAAAGLGAMTIALVLADLVAFRPEQPSLLALCGDVLGPAMGVMIAWSYWISIWVSNAVIATAAAGYLAAFVPPIGQSPLRIALGGIAIVIALTVANLRGPGTAGRIQVVTTILKLLPLVVILIILAGLLLGTGEAFSRYPHVPFDFGSLTPALPLAFYALLGFESATLMTELVRDPARNVARAVIGGLAITTLVYYLVCTGIVMALPADRLALSPMPMALFVEQFIGIGPAMVLALFAVIAAIGSLNGLILLQGEIPHSLARSGLLPGWMATTNRHGVAAAPLILASALTFVLMIAGATRFGGGVLDFLLRLTASVSIWFYFGACVAALILRRRRLLAAAGIVFSGWLFYSTGLEAGGWGLALMLLGLPVHFAAKRTVVRAA